MNPADNWRPLPVCAFLAPASPVICALIGLCIAQSGTISGDFRTIMVGCPIVGSVIGILLGIALGIFSYRRGERQALSAAALSFLLSPFVILICPSLWLAFYWSLTGRAL